MERYIYINNIFYDRVSNSAEQMAAALGAEIQEIEPVTDGFGQSENVYLRKENHEPTGY